MSLSHFTTGLRSTHSVLVAFSLITSWTAGCNHSPSSSGELVAADDADTSPGDETSSASQGKRPASAPSNGAYYPTVLLKTSMGDLTLKLDPQAAPRTVNNFLHYVENGFYNQTIFHQVDKGYVVLGGAYGPDLVERSSRYPIPNEATNGRKNVRGTVAMARQVDDIDSSTCQFFINLNDNPHLDHLGDEPEQYGFCVFGEVVEGVEVLEKISAVEVQDKDDFKKIPVETVLIESAYRLR
jgi:peptidyl-prolyl cis-trans isomerase A (cyclophilin A)